MEGVTVAEANTPPFRKALKKTLADELAVPVSTVKELLISQSRRMLLSGVTVAYVVTVYDGTTSEQLTASLRSSQEYGTFSISLSTYSGSKIKNMAIVSVHDNMPLSEIPSSAPHENLSSTQKGNLHVFDIEFGS